MSANNVIWSMDFHGNFHVFYSGCFDNDPTVPDYEDQYYKSFTNRKDALVYAHDIVRKIDAESYEDGYIGVEYGVCEVPANYADNKLKDKIYHVDKIIEEWKQKIKDLQFSVEQFEDWKKELKASGSEKEGSARHTQPYSNLSEVKPIGNQSENSKLPEPNCDNCWKKGNYDLFMCPTKEKCIPARDYSPKGSELKPKKRKGGCYQFTYCNECLAYPMGLGCPNLTKGPVQLKDEFRLP